MARKGQFPLILTSRIEACWYFRLPIYRKVAALPLKVPHRSSVLIDEINLSHKPYQPYLPPPYTTPTTTSPISIAPKPPPLAPSQQTPLTLAPPTTFHFIPILSPFPTGPQTLSFNPPTPVFTTPTTKLSLSFEPPRASFLHPWRPVVPS